MDTGLLMNERVEWNMTSLPRTVISTASSKSREKGKRDFTYVTLILELNVYILNPK